MPENQPVPSPESHRKTKTDKKDINKGIRCPFCRGTGMVDGYPAA